MTPPLVERVSTARVKACLYIRAVRNPSTMIRQLSRALCLLLLLTALVACQHQTTATPATRTPSSEPASGGELMLLGSDPSTLDPHLSSDTTSASIVVEVFGGLVTLDRELQVMPDLAERWELGPDGRSYTFHLRPGARFHDGKRVTAEDFKWSLERATDPATGSPAAGQYLGDIVGVADRLSGEADELAGVRVLDEDTLEISIDAPKSYFLSKLTYPVAFVLDQENVEGNPEWTQSPNGTGPFKLGEYTRGKRLVLERNPHYHLGAPYLDRVDFLLGGGSPMLMYENDEVHVVGVGTSTLERVMDPESPLHSQLLTLPGEFSVYYVGMNVNEPPFDDVHVRQAFNYALDRERIAHSAFDDRVVPAAGVLPPDFPGHNPNLKGYEYDPQKARELLADSRYQPGSLPEIVLTIPGTFGSLLGLDTDLMRAMWRDNLGVDVKVQQTELATFLQDLQRRRLQMFQIGWVADFPDPQNFLDNLFHSGSENNRTAYSNAEVDSLLEQARLERDERARSDLYRQAEEMIVRDAPWVFLWHPGPTYILVKPYVHDYRPAPIVVPILRYVYMTR